MHVHHLNCAAIVFDDVPEPLRPLPCHVLLCETDSGLVLVDSGFGTADYLDDDRLGAGRGLIGPPSDLSFTALRQIEAMGYTAVDVTDIVVTHMDRDHIGGLSDFPRARVHTTLDEFTAAVAGTTAADESRYRSQQWEHDPEFVVHEGRGDPWRYGLNGHSVVPGVTLIPMPGHTPGHAIVAVDAGDGSVIIHAGDAAFDGSSHGALSAHGDQLGEIEFLRLLEVGTSYNAELIPQNHSVLARLALEPGVRVVNSHDARLL